VSAGALLWTIAGLLVTALLSGLAYLIRDWLRIRANEGAKDSEIAAKDETIKRILKEKESAERIHASRPISDFDTSGRL
jgi:hypothetical protein